MRVNIKELQEGCILSDDVFSLTNRPIITKKTVLNLQLINILNVFLIKEVVVEKTLVNGKPFRPKQLIEEDVSKEKSEETFLDHYLHAVQYYKKEFKSWQAGSPIDISKIRKILVPLIEKSDQSSSEIFTLHHYSAKEDYLFHHAISVALICSYIAKKLNYNTGDCLQVAIAGCLSDCGMSKLSPAIINKKSSLNSEEFNEIKLHPTYSYRMIQNLSLLQDGVKIAVFQHHERLDGTGYPKGEVAENIHPYAKIIAVADIFHAMTSERLYKSKHSPFKVLEKIIEDMFGKLDISVVKALSSGIMSFSTGSQVKLSNGEIAEIMFIQQQFPTRPLVKLISNDEIIHLEKHRSIYIEEILKS